jgi:hypothetical protein
MPTNSRQKICYHDLSPIPGEAITVALCFSLLSIEMKRGLFQVSSRHTASFLMRLVFLVLAASLAKQLKAQFVLTTVPFFLFECCTNISYLKWLRNVGVTV